MTQQKDFSVAIIGGGIGGLATAIGLLRAGIKVDVYESAVSSQWLVGSVERGVGGLGALPGNRVDWRGGRCTTLHRWAVRPMEVG